MGSLNFYFLSESLLYFSLMNQIYASPKLNYVKLCGISYATTWHTRDNSTVKVWKATLHFYSLFHNYCVLRHFTGSLNKNFCIDPIVVWILKPNSDLLKFIWWCGRLKVALFTFFKKNSFELFLIFHTSLL